MTDSTPHRLPARSRASPARAGSMGLAGLLVLLLSGCTYSSAELACQQAAQKTSAPVRVMVQFRQAMAGGSPEVLGQLQSYSRGCVGYVSSVSPTLHVYAVSGGGDAQALRVSLLQWPAVKDVVADAKASPGEAR